MLAVDTMNMPETTGRSRARGALEHPPILGTEILTILKCDFLHR